MTELCRVCLTSHEELILLVKLNTPEMELSNCGDMFEECLNIRLNSTLEYDKICMDCKIQLKYFYDFKKKALQSNDWLKLQLYNINDNNDKQQENIGSIKEDQDIYYHETELHELNNNIEILENISDEINQDESYNYEEDNCVVEYLDADYVDVINGNENETDDVLESAETQADNISYIDEDDENCNVYYTQSELGSIEYNYLEESDPKTTEIEIINEESHSTTMTEKNLTNKKDKFVSQKSKKIRCKLMCRVCKKIFRSQRTYTAHANMHKGLLPWICELCGKGFPFRVNYSYHLKIHANMRSHVCPVCSKTFICKWDLKIHKRLHTNTKPFACHLCEKSFRIQSHWKSHLETHNATNTFECLECHQKYKTRASLRSHITSIHSDIKFMCHLCDKTFNRKHHLLIHSKSHMKEINTEHQN